jgi:hypothetical protein
MSRHWTDDLDGPAQGLTCSGRSIILAARRFLEEQEEQEKQDTDQFVLDKNFAAMVTAGSLGKSLSLDQIADIIGKAPQVTQDPLPSKRTTKLRRVCSLPRPYTTPNGRICVQMDVYECTKCGHKRYSKTFRLPWTERGSLEQDCNNYDGFCNCIYGGSYDEENEENNIYQDIPEDYYMYIRSRCPVLCHEDPNEPMTLFKSSKHVPGGRIVYHAKRYSNDDDKLEENVYYFFPN